MLAPKGAGPAHRIGGGEAREALGTGNAQASKPTPTKFQASGDSREIARAAPRGLAARKSAVRQVSAKPRGEESGDWPHVVAKLGDRWRVIRCRDGIQWIIQSRRGPNSWRNRYFCRTREGLIGCAREYAGPIDGFAMAVLLRLPEQIGGVTGSLGCALDLLADYLSIP